MSIRCHECKKLVVDELVYPSWLSLMNFIQFLYMENCITEVTYEHMINDLMILKPED
jgi:hypothetical protein